MQRSSDFEKTYREFFERFESSGLSVKEFCDKESISKKSFYYRRKRIKIIDQEKVSHEKNNELKMLPVSLPIPAPQNNNYYKIHFNDGTELTIPECFNSVTTGELIRLCRVRY